MFGTIWHTFFFDPVYNGLVFFIDALPGGDVGLAIVCITIVVKVLLLPLSAKAARTQAALREIEPKLKSLKEKITDKQEQAQAMMKLYAEAGINPFASIILLFVQLPIIFALYLSVSRGGGIPLPDINIDLLYAFIPIPESASTMFLGLFDITSRNLPLALLAGLTQFLNTHFSLPKLEPRDPEAAPSMKEDFTRNMHLQMRFVMPLVITFFAYSISASIAIYFVVSNIMGIVQEFYVRKHRKPITNEVLQPEQPQG